MTSEDKIKKTEESSAEDTSLKAEDNGEKSPSFTEENIEVETVSKEGSRQNLGKIEIKKIPSNQVFIDSSAVVKKKKFSFKKNKSKVMGEVRAKKIKEKNEHEEKVDKVIKSIKDLFAPFKEIILKTLPFTKILILIIDKLALLIGFLAKTLALRLPTIIKFIKSKYFAILIVLLISLFILGAIISRAVNSNTYIRIIEGVIYEHTGYNVSITGVIKVSFIPTLAVSINNINFHINDGKNTDFQLTNLSAENMLVRFKFLPLLISNFEVKDLTLRQVTADIQTASLETQHQKIDFSSLILNIKDAIRTKVTKEVVQAINIEDKSSQTPEDSIIAEMRSLIGKNDSSGDLKSESLLLNNLLDDVEDIHKSIVQDSIIDSSKDEDIIKNKVIRPSSIVSSSQQASGLVFNIVSYFVRNISFTYQNISTINISRGKFNLITPSNQRIVSIDSFWGKFSSQGSSKVISDGSFRFADSNFIYDIKTSFSNGGYDFSLSLALGRDISNGINIIGMRTSKTGVFSGYISSKGDIFALFINNFLIPTTDTNLKNYNFKANFKLDSSFLEIYNIDFSNKINIFKGTFVWDYSLGGNYVDLNLSLNTPDITPFFNSYNGILNTSVVRGSKFLSFVETTSNWKHKNINSFRANYFKFNLNVNGTILNTQEIDNLNIDFFIDNYNKLYINNVSFKQGDAEINAVGELDLIAKSGIVTLKSEGKAQAISKILGLDITAQNFLSLIGDVPNIQENTYSLGGKVILDNNRVIINEIQGRIGNRVIKDTYALYFERSIKSDLIITSKMSELSLEYLNGLYEKQLKNIFYEENKDINIFGISKDLLIKFNIAVDKFTYRNLNFKNANLEIDLISSGLLFKKFEASGEHGGSVIASFNADNNVTPVIAGHLNMSDLFVKLEELDGLIFSGKKIIGNVLLNGRLRFSGESYENIFSRVDGELSFIKYERVRLSRFANLSGLYLTLSEETNKGKTRYLVNDLYGKVNILNSQLEFYPVAMLYILNKKEYRGTFQGVYNLSTSHIKLNGIVDNIADINKKIEFSINGDISSPKIMRRNIVITQNSRGVQPAQPEDTTQKTHMLSNAMNNTEDKEHFNNIYNFNMNNKEQELKEKVFNNDILTSGKQKEYDFNDSYGAGRIKDDKEKNQDDYIKSLEDIKKKLESNNASNDDFKNNYSPKRSK